MFRSPAALEHNLIFKMDNILNLTSACPPWKRRYATSDER
jgi:hypothetical protein